MQGNAPSTDSTDLQQSQNSKQLLTVETVELFYKYALESNTKLESLTHKLLNTSREQKRVAESKFEIYTRTALEKRTFLATEFLTASLNILNSCKKLDQLDEFYELLIFRLCRQYLDQYLQLQDWNLSQDSAWQECRNCAFLAWKRVHPRILPQMLQYFAVGDRLSKRDLLTHCNNLISNDKQAEAANLIVACGWHYLCDNLTLLKDLIKRFIDIDKLDEAERVLHVFYPKETSENQSLNGSKTIYVELAQFYVQILIHKQRMKKAQDFAQSLGLDLTLFPELSMWFDQDRAAQLAVTANFSDWEKLEERFSYSSAAVEEITIKLLMSRGKEVLDIATSIAKRQKFTLPKQLLLGVSDFQYIENRYFVSDGFGATEDMWNERESGVQQKQYLHITEFGLRGLKDVLFVDENAFANKTIRNELERELFQTAHVGVDTEQAPFQQLSKKDKELALMQLATSEKVYLLDLFALKNNSEFVDLVRRFFASEDVAKIGHDINQDMKLIKDEFALKEEKNLIDVGAIYMKQMGRKQLNSLAHMTLDLLGKKLSKREQISNWIRRPLLQCQMHYAAMDALVCLKIYDILCKRQISQNIQDNPQTETRSITMQIAPQLNGKCFICPPKCEYYYSEPKKIKFVVDNMLKKLVKYLRNVGIDTAYQSNKDEQQLVYIARKEERIILTKDHKLFGKKKDVPIYLFLNGGRNTEEQFLEVRDFFKIENSQEGLLSRCVKCNSVQIHVTTVENVRNYILFNNDSDYQRYEFWQCEQCKQIYWEGATFLRSRERFKNLIGTALEDKIVKFPGLASNRDLYYYHYQELRD